MVVFRIVPVTWLAVDTENVDRTILLDKLKIMARSLWERCVENEVMATGYNVHRMYRGLFSYLQAPCQLQRKWSVCEHGDGPVVLSHVVHNFAQPLRGGLGLPHPESLHTHL